MAPSPPTTTAQKNGIVASSRVHPQLDADEQARTDELIAKYMAALSICCGRYVDPGNYIPAEQYLRHHQRNKAAEMDGQQPATTIDVYSSKCPNLFFFCESTILIIIIIITASGFSHAPSSQGAHVYGRGSGRRDSRAVKAPSRENCHDGK